MSDVPPPVGPAEPGPYTTFRQWEASHWTRRLIVALAFSLVCFVVVLAQYSWGAETGPSDPDFGWNDPGQVEANVIPGRFAGNLIFHHRLLYNTPGIQISAYPVVPVFLAFAYSSPRILLLVFYVAPILSGVLLYFLSNGRWLAAIVYLIGLNLLPSIIMIVLLTLCLTGLYLADQRRWHLAGIFFGLAILTEPSALVFAFLALIWSIIEGRWRGYLFFATPTVAAGLIPIFLAFGPSVRLYSPGLPSILLVAPAALLCLIPHLRDTLRRNRGIAIFSASVSFLISLSLIRGVTISASPILSAQIAGQWIAANSGPDATLATTEIGALASSLDRPVIDLSGKLEQIPFDKYFFIHYAPDVVALKDGTDIAWKDITTTYDKKVIEGYAIYRRVVNFSPLDDHGVDVALGQQLGEGLGQISMHLSNVAIGNVLHPGDLVRIRLDWELAHPPSYPVEIRLNLLNDQGQVIKGATDQIPASEWAAGSTSTYHLIVLPGDKVNDRLSLYLGVSVRGGDLLNILKVAEVTRAAPTS